MHRFFFLLLVPLAAFAACTADRERASSSAEDTSGLIGGREAKLGELPATMLVKGNCTVAKVGPRHILTAAHCVMGSLSMFAPGKAITITPAKAVGPLFADGAAPEWRDVVIDRLEVQPDYRDKCATIPCLSVNVGGRTDVADAAVIITRDDIAGIPDAAVDLSPVAIGDRVAVTGYGCEQTVGGSWNYDNRRLRIAETEAIPFDRVIHPGSFITPADRDNGIAAMMATHYVITPGPTDPANPDAGNVEGRGGLCPGDSGGPLYRIGEGEPVVVGVNANYTFITGHTSPLDDAGATFNYGGSPVTNWHTRLDIRSGKRVGAWLRDLGVRTTCTRRECGD
jgi:hypothetical protein